MPKNNCLDSRYSQWLREKSDEMKWHYAATAKAVMFLTFDLCFYFYISRYCTALPKAVSFINLNPLGACVAGKQQSDEKLCKSENNQSLIIRWQPRYVRSSVTVLMGNFNFYLKFQSFSNVLHQKH